jgi:hypothetical protein
MACGSPSAFNAVGNPGGTDRVDEYSRSGPKNPRSEALLRERETRRRMDELAAIKDEKTLKDVLHQDLEIDENHHRFKLILKTWRELQRRRP